MLPALVMFCLKVSMLIVVVEVFMCLKLVNFGINNVQVLLQEVRLLLDPAQLEQP